MKTAVSIPGPLFQAAERMAKRLGMPRSRLYAKAIERYLSEAQAVDVTTLLNEVYGGDTSELDPLIERMQVASISREEW